MEKTPTMRVLEAATKRDVRAVILDAITRQGSVAKAADELGLTPAGLYQWIERLNGTVVTTTEVTFNDFEYWALAQSATEPATA